MSNEALSSFEWENKPQSVKFVEAMQVTSGVECDVYTFIGDFTKDLGIIKIQPGHKTPLQKVLMGERTIEGYISGKGALHLTRTNGEQEIHTVGDKPQEQFSVNVMVGDLMQWQAAKDSELVAYEICFPPYADGRYENIE